MKRFVAVLVLPLLLALPAVGQEPDPTAKQQPDSTAKQQPDPTAKETPAATPGEKRAFFGGTIGLSFGSYLRVSVQPMIGYNFSKMFSGGVKLGYEYISDSRYNPTVTWNNYGASVFGRLRFIPQLYLHTEFAYVNYGVKTGGLESERIWVPFLYLGAGYYHSITSSTALFVEVLVDVLQDSNSPYEAWQPMISFGVVAGI